MQTHAYAQSKSTSQTKSQTATTYASSRKNNTAQQLQISHILRKAKPGALLVGSTGDVFEQEAERISEQLHQPRSDSSLQLVQNQIASVDDKHSTPPDDVKKMQPAAAELTQPARGEQKTQENTTEERQLNEPQLQRKTASSSSTASELSESGITRRINSPTGGESLISRIKSFVSSILPYDFSRVKVHQDKQAQQDTAAVGARAFTFKNHIWLGQGESAADSRLMAHELTHVAQQGAAPYIGSTHGRDSFQDSSQENSTAAEVLQTDNKLQRNVFGDAWDSGTEFVSDVAQDVADWGADRFWDLVESVASESFVSFLREVVDKGIFTYLKDKIASAAASIFDSLSNSSDLLGRIFEVFGGFLTSAGEIVTALASGDCGPLFAALERLKETAGAIAGEAWSAITDFLSPVGDFFTNLWANYGAPVLDWLQETAGDVWTFISELGAQIWSWTQPVRSALSSAWDWVKGQLGLTSSEGEGEGGLMAWVTEQAQAAWDKVKEELRPITEPVQEVIAKVTDILPLDAILNLRETVNGWLQSASSAASALDEEQGGDVAERQDSLREELLPAILSSIMAFREQLVFAGLWVSEKIGAVISVGTRFISALANTPLLSHAASALQWFSEALERLREWSANTVQTVFSLLGNALVYLSDFIQPILNILRQIVDTLGNLLAKLPDLLMGPLWWVLPYCIKASIKNFFIEQILSRIPLFGELVKVGELWAKLRDTALEILARIFIDGDLLGALWLFFKSMLNLIGIPAKLVLSIIIKGATAFSDILMNPIAFIGNLLKSLKNGFFNFFSNILSHLFGGVTDWLFGQLNDAGINPPESFSFSAVLSFVFEVLGITLQNIVKKVAVKLGRPELEERIMQMVEYATDAWQWISDIINGGPAALWEKIQEKISNLWDSVLDSVVGWVNRVIIERATRWLMSLLDVTGIMPVINALIAIYNAIESFIAYIREMLEIIESMLMSIGAIAKGQISDAAVKVESSLAQAVPVVVGFLANQFGFGAIGQRIAEIIESVREKVDSAIDWLIEKAISGGQAFINLLKAGKQALVNWWAGKYSFKDASGADHELSFAGSESSAELYVSSENKRPFLSYLEESDNEPARRKYNEITIILNTLRSAQDGSPEKTTARENLTKALNELMVILAGSEIDPAQMPDGNARPIPIRYFKKESDFPLVKDKSPTTGVDLGDFGILKVDTANFIKTGDVLVKKSQRSDGAPMPEIKEALKAVDGNTPSSGISDGETILSPLSFFFNNIWHLDHILELTLGGKDDKNNLWPLAANKNIAANVVLNQRVGYFDVNNNQPMLSDTVKNLPGKWFKEGSNARPGIPGSAAGAGGISNAAQIDSANKTPTGNSKADAININYFKTPQDYPNIAITDKDGNNRSYSATQGITLQHKNKEYKLKVSMSNFGEPDISAHQKKTSARESEGAEFQNIKKILGEMVAESANIGDLQKQGDLSEQIWQLDHVHESRLGGAQKKDNFWPLSAQKNNAANATYNQKVQLQSGTEVITKKVSDLPEGTKFVVMENKNIPSDAGKHGTSNDNPANKNSIELNPMK